MKEVKAKLAAAGVPYLHRLALGQKSPLRRTSPPPGEKVKRTLIRRSWCNHMFQLPARGQDPARFRRGGAADAFTTEVEEGRLWTACCSTEEQKGHLRDNASRCQICWSSWLGPISGGV